jgi:hypothetical protein
MFLRVAVALVFADREHFEGRTVVAAFLQARAIALISAWGNAATRFALPIHGIAEFGRGAGLDMLPT